MQRNLSEELRRIYRCSPDELLAHTSRYDRLLTFYRSNFSGPNPVFLVRAPGRVNLIGEHTDYNGYPVMPMAIDRDVVFVCTPRKDATIEIINEASSFQRRTFDARFPVAPYTQGDWGNYVKAAVHGILNAGLLNPKTALGFQAIIGGTIPESAGLSSSSALVVASALTFLAANRKEVDKEELAELLAHAERYVGSEGGGMDQAVSLLAEAGKALKIDFFPLRTEPVSLPQNLSFIVCNSLIRAPKSESIRYAYNRRAVECRLATALIAGAVHERWGKMVESNRLADLSGERLGHEQRTVDKIVAQAVGESPLFLKEISRLLREPAEIVQKRYCTLGDGTVLVEPPDGFKIWNRYRHVVSEARRVNDAAGALGAGENTVVGELMNQSQASCRDDYEISCPELEALVSIAREHGAIGSRLTGAGFGGCTVNAVPMNRVDNFIRGVTAAYYQGYVQREKGRPFTQYTNLQDVMFLCRATTGAGAWPMRGDH